MERASCTSPTTCIQARESSKTCSISQRDTLTSMSRRLSRALIESGDTMCPLTGHDVRARVTFDASADDTFTIVDSAGASVDHHMTSHETTRQDRRLLLAGARALLEAHNLLARKVAVVVSGRNLQDAYENAMRDRSDASR